VTAPHAGVDVRLEVRPPSPFRLPRHGALDGMLRVRGGVVHRLVHCGGEPVVVRVAQLGRDRVLFGAEAAGREAAERGIERVRLMLGVDHDLTDFYERFRLDPMIGRSVRSDPGLRVIGRATPFEALTWAICEQLIDSERAAAIERRLTARLGRRCARTGLRDAPTADAVAGVSPARLESCGLSGLRAITLWRAAREVALGRVDLDDGDHERGWRRLRRIPGIGSWTLQLMALNGQGRLDQLPAGDLAYVKLVGRLQSGARSGRASEAEVDAFFARFAPWGALAGAHALHAVGGPGAAIAFAA
jgi:3-methyladenine DNA glycosylase/8-oxoguanine DNA glycosylase